MQFTEEKLIMGVGCIILVFVSWLLSAHYYSLQVGFSTFTGSVLGIYGLFAGGSVANKFISSRYGEYDSLENVPLNDSLK